MTPHQRRLKRKSKRKRMRRLNRKKRKAALVAKIARRLKGEKSKGFEDTYVLGWDVSNYIIPDESSVVYHEHHM